MRDITNHTHMAIDLAVCIWFVVVVVVLLLLTFDQSIERFVSWLRESHRSQIKSSKCKIYLDVSLLFLSSFFRCVCVFFCTDARIKLLLIFNSLYFVFCQIIYDSQRVPCTLYRHLLEITYKSKSREREKRHENCAPIICMKLNGFFFSLKAITSHFFSGPFCQHLFSFHCSTRREFLAVPFRFVSITVYNLKSTYLFQSI